MKLLNDKISDTINYKYILIVSNNKLIMALLAQQLLQKMNK